MSWCSRSSWRRMPVTRSRMVQMRRSMGGGNCASGMSAATALRRLRTGGRGDGAEPAALARHLEVAHLAQRRGEAELLILVQGHMVLHFRHVPGADRERWHLKQVEFGAVANGRERLPLRQPVR